MTTANTYPGLHLILLYTISCFCAILASCWLQLLIYHGTKTVTLAIIQLSEQEEIVQKDVCPQTISLKVSCLITSHHVTFCVLNN